MGVWYFVDFPHYECNILVSWHVHSARNIWAKYSDKTYFHSSNNIHVCKIPFFKFVFIFMTSTVHQRIFKYWFVFLPLSESCKIKIGYGLVSGNLTPATIETKLFNSFSSDDWSDWMSVCHTKFNTIMNSNCVLTINRRGSRKLCCSKTNSDN